MSNTNIPSSSNESISFGNRQTPLIAVSVFTETLALTAVVLRFTAKKVVKANLWFDDLAAGLSLIFATGEFALIMVATSKYGLGRHPQEAGYGGLSQRRRSQFLSGIWVCNVLFRLSLVFAKYSMLLLFWRLFSKKKYIRIGSFVLCSIITTWALGVILTSTLQCLPVNHFWHVESYGRCFISPYDLFLGTSITNTCTDVALLVFPLPVIWRLNSSRVQKVGLTITFMLGGIVCIISIIRLAVVTPGDFELDDLTWGFTTVALWTMIETHIAIVCTCLASLRPLLALFTVGSLKAMRWRLAQSHERSTSWTSDSTRRVSIERADNGSGSTKREGVRRYENLSDAQYGFDFNTLLDLNATSGDAGDFGNTTVIETGNNESYLLGPGIQIKQEVVVS